MKNNFVKTNNNSIFVIKMNMDNNKIQVKIKKLVPEAVIPSYAHDGDVCMDLTAISLDYDIEHDMYIYHTGLAFESDFNIGQFLYLRSSNCKTDAYLCNGVGVADSPIYRGEIQLRMKNRTSIRQILFNEKLSLNLNVVLNALSSKLNNIGVFGGLSEPYRDNIIDKCIDSIHMSSIIASQNEEKWYEQLDLSAEYVKNKALELAPYKVGDRVGQMVFMRYPTVELIVTDELSDTSRGAGGFGSSGK